MDSVQAAILANGATDSLRPEVKKWIEMERRAQATTPAASGGAAIGSPMLDDVKQALGRTNAWMRIADVAGPDDPRRTQGTGSELRLPFITTVPAVGTTAENTQITVTDAVYGQRVPTRREPKTTMAVSVEWAQDTVDRTHVPAHLMERIGEAQNTAITPDILADVPDSGIGAGPVSRTKVLQMLQAFPSRYLRAPCGWETQA